MAKKRHKVREGINLNELKQKDPLQVEKQRKKSKRREIKRASYDLTPQLRDNIKLKAARHGLPASQFAMFLLTDALKRYDAGDIDPTPFLSESTSPKFANNLEYDDQWYYEGD